MKQQAIIIQARTGSTRLPNKVMMEIGDGKGLLQMVIDNLTTRFPNELIILATTSQASDDAVAEIGENADLEVIRGDEHNVLSRFILATKRYSIDEVIRVCADNPFLNMDGISTLLNHRMGKADYVSYALPNGRPIIKSHLGLFAEKIKATALEKTADLTQDSLYLEHVTNYIYSHPERFDCQWLNLPFEHEETANIRLTLDDDTDYDFCKSLYKSLGTQVQDIDKLVSFVTQGDHLELMKKQIAKYEK